MRRKSLRAGPANFAPINELRSQMSDYAQCDRSDLGRAELKAMIDLPDAETLPETAVASGQPIFLIADRQLVLSAHSRIAPIRLSSPAVCADALRAHRRLHQ
jgi:hypothetical protein